MRLNVLKLVLEVVSKSDSEFKQTFVVPLIEEFQADRDPDVSYTLELIKETI